jgi:hypothetical protein
MILYVFCGLAADSMAQNGVLVGLPSATAAAAAAAAALISAAAGARFDALFALAGAGDSKCSAASSHGDHLWQ